MHGPADGTAFDARLGLLCLKQSCITMKLEGAWRGAPCRRGSTADAVSTQTHLFHQTQSEPRQL